MNRVIIAAVIVGAVALLLFAGVQLSLRGEGPAARNSEFAEGRFLVLLFPIQQGSSLDRAVIASLSEYERESIEVFVDGAAVAVPKGDLATIPPRDYGPYVKRLNEELDAWGAQTDWSEIKYGFTSSEGGGKAIVSVRDKTGSTRRYTYIINESSIKPVDVTTEVDLSKKMAQ